MFSPMTTNTVAETFGFLFAISGATLFGAAWLTHVVVCFHAGLWGFLIAGALFFPVAIVHGIGLWFGAF